MSYIYFIARNTVKFCKFLAIFYSADLQRMIQLVYTETGTLLYGIYYVWSYLSKTESELEDVPGAECKPESSGSCCSALSRHKT